MERSVLRGFTLIGLMIVVALVGMLLQLILPGFMADESEAMKAANVHGFKEVVVTDRHRLFVGYRGCSDSDDAKFDLRAKSPSGQQVTFFVCVGWPFKGATLRTN